MLDHARRNYWAVYCSSNDVPETPWLICAKYHFKSQTHHQIVPIEKRLLIALRRISILFKKMPPMDT